MTVCADFHRSVVGRLSVVRRTGVAALHCVCVGLAACLPAVDELDGAPPRLPRTIARAVTAPGERVVGRAQLHGRVVLLTDSRRLISITSEGRVEAREVVGAHAEEPLWALATPGDGTLWTLAGHDMLLQLSPRGDVVRRARLSQPCAGVHSGVASLLYQPYGDFQVGAPALRAGPPGTIGAEAGSLQVLPANGLRAEVWLMSLVQCSPPRAARVACWLAGHPIVNVINAGGDSRSIRLGEFRTAATRDAAAFARAGTPLLRDVTLTDDGSLLVLADAPGQSGAVGAGTLWRYSTGGVLRGRKMLRERARLVLGVQGQAVRVLTNGASIEEVDAP